MPSAGYTGISTTLTDVTEVEWSPTQARVFALLLDKCVPDLSPSFVVQEERRGDLATLSREELEALAGTADGRLDA